MDKPTPVPSADTPPKTRRFFASYSHEDREVVEEIVKLMVASGASVFRDTEIPLGKRWRVVLDQSLRDADAVVLFWSKNAGGSVEVEREWRQALALKKDVIPVILDSSKLPRQLATFQHVRLAQILRLGHPFEDALAELAELISIRLMQSGEADRIRHAASGAFDEERSLETDESGAHAPDAISPLERRWWAALRRRWSKE
jgi:hypothetical protein